MRPVRLELEGFTAFRERAVVDFEEADLFALTGPTGSGKTSLIDAICFALYGAVPRYEDRRLVAPVITQGMSQARVRFDFSVGDDTYSAVRVVRRTAAGGASTREASLERGEAVLAEDAPGVTAGVERLLGLDFDHFTKCVVLPQGEFAGFLHDTPAGRQELLRRLLDLEVFRAMAQRANQRATEAETRVTVLEGRLAELGEATESDRDRALGRVEELERLSSLIDERMEVIGDLDERRRELAGRIEQAERALESLEEISSPKDLEEVAAGREKAEEEMAAARAAAEEVRLALERADRALESLPDPGPILEARQTRTLQQELRKEMESVRSELERARARSTATAEAAEAAASREREALDRRLEAERRHAAAALAVTLEVGRPCPVCARPVEEVPETEAPAELRGVEEEVQRAAADHQEARKEANAAQGKVVALEARSSELYRRLEQTERSLTGFPELPEIEELLAARRHAEDELRSSRRAQTEVASLLSDAEAAREGWKEALERLRGSFHRARDAVAALGPPQVGEDVVANWRLLVVWAKELVPVQAKAVQARRAEAQEIERERQAATGDLRQACAKSDLEVDDDRFRQACTEALASARLEVRRIDEAIEEAERLRKERDERQAEGTVARELARLLGAKGFEQWLVEEAVTSLLTAANRIVAQLSAGSFSLVIAEGGGAFEVVDHLNADERRPVRTLSGGETFLASLALALSLAEELAAMSVHGAARVESIFLDEGFGTLDAETLETVASVIHELGAGGRTVGIVTHVRELADQMPVRFEVHKGVRTAEVTRVS